MKIFRTKNAKNYSEQNFQKGKLILYNILNYVIHKVIKIPRFLWTSSTESNNHQFTRRNDCDTLFLITKSEHSVPRKGREISFTGILWITTIQPPLSTVF